MAVRQLASDFLSQRGRLAAVTITVLVPGACDHDPGGDRDEERCNLRNHRVANRENGKTIGCLTSSHSLIRNPDDDPGDDIDERNDKAGNCIPFDKLHRTIHTAMQLTFQSQTTSAQTRLMRGDVAPAQIGIDAHLLTGHRIQGKTRADFCNALRPFCNDDKLDGCDNQKDNHPNDKIASNDKFSEAFNNMAGIGME